MVFELCLTYHNKVSPWYAEEFFIMRETLCPMLWKGRQVLDIL